MREAIEFIFNGQPRRLTDFDPNQTVLNYVRETERTMGSKEGCAEGDCGACTAVMVELDGGRLRYLAVNTCIQFLAMLDGKSLITVENLKSASGMHPVQTAMVDEHGSQCGFCTPGFVMSMFAGVQNNVLPERPEIDEMLAGNLCRCTGYTPIINAAKQVLQQAGDVRVSETDERLLTQQLESLPTNEGLSIHSHDKRFIAPVSMDDLSRILLEHPDATVLAGGTDAGLFVTKKHLELTTLVHIGKVPELARIEEVTDGIRLGAAVTYERARQPLAALYPSIGDLIGRIGAVQVRNLGTIGGNIANGSPIGDMPPALIAAGARLTLRHGDVSRELPLEQFFIAYGKQDRAPGEFVEAIWVPRPDPAGVLKVYKISKRIDQDISSVCAAFNLTFRNTSDGRVVTSARICFGGMAGTPLRALECENFLTERLWDQDTVEEAVDLLMSTYRPLNDARASAVYRNQVAGNLLRKYFLETETLESTNVGVVCRQF